MCNGIRQRLRKLGISKPDISPSGTNAGLWLDRYLGAAVSSHKIQQHSEGHNAEASDTEKLLLLKQAERLKVPEGYRRAFARRERFLQKYKGDVTGATTKLYQSEVQGRMIVGLGVESVWENNVSLLHTWGIPFIPGSALKGLAAAAAQRLSEQSSWKKKKPNQESRHEEKLSKGGQSDEQQGPQLEPHTIAESSEDHQILFGDNESAGYVTFHDAWWIPEGRTLPLCRDVMATHHPEYYTNPSHRQSPSDTDEPTPIPFLTCHGKYLLALTGPLEWVEAAEAWLRHGLRWLGIGGKTAAGYGRMTMHKRLSSKEKRTQELEAKLQPIIEAFDNPDKRQGHQAARQLYELARQGAREEKIRVNGAKLYQIHPSYWKKFPRDKSHPEEVREFVREYVVAPGKKSQAEAAPAASHADRSPSPTRKNKKKPIQTWVAGEAWIENDRKGRPRVRLRLAGQRSKPLKEKGKNVEYLPLSLKDRLEQADSDQPKQVRALLEKNKKIRKLAEPNATVE